MAENSITQSNLSSFDFPFQPPPPPSLRHPPASVTNQHGAPPPFQRPDEFVTYYVTNWLGGLQPFTEVKSGKWQIDIVTYYVTNGGGLVRGAIAPLIGGWRERRGMCAGG